MDQEFQTEFEFDLPKGYLDAQGALHRHGTMAPGHRGGRNPAAPGTRASCRTPATSPSSCFRGWSPRSGPSPRWTPGSSRSSIRPTSRFAEHVPAGERHRADDEQLRLPRVRAQIRAAGKFYGGGIAVYPETELYKEASFLAYYYHWDYRTVMTLDTGPAGASAPRFPPSTRS